jgi:hypothetical protein
MEIIGARKIELETDALNIKTALSSPSFDLATGGAALNNIKSKRHVVS